MSVRELPRGGWQARFSIKGHRHERAGFDTREDAEAWEQWMRATETIGSAPTPDQLRMTVGDYARRWIRNYDGGPATTRAFYATNLNVHIIPRLGHRRILDVKPTDIKVLLDQIVKAKTLETASAVYRTLHAMFALAEQEDVITKNPVRSKLHRPKVPQKKMSILEPDEARAMLMHMQGQARDIAVLLLSTGMRWGEMAGLAGRGDVDLVAGTIEVRRTVNDLEVGPTKNRRRRTLEIPDRAAKVVARLCDDVGNVEPIGELPGKTDDRDQFRYRWLLQTGQGRPVDGGNWSRRHLQPAAEAAGITKHLRPHDMRHTYVSWMLAAGHPVSQVAFWIGDAQRTVETTYAHVLKGAGREAKATVDQLLG